MKMRRFLAAGAALLLPALAVQRAHAKGGDGPVTEAELAVHIRILASDAFEGRAPGTGGEDRTIAYIVGEWAKAGLEPVPGSATPWLQPVPFVESEPLTSRATFKVRGRDIRLERSEEHTSELQSLMRISYAVFCLKKKK